MTKADTYLYNDIKKILTRGCKDVDPRPKYSDGTPAYTYFVTHNIRSYDLSKGEFPITTLRPIAWKSAIKEIFWIYQKRSTSLDVLKNEFGIKYWDDWESDNYPKTIGHTYGYIVDKYDLFNKRVLNDIKENPYGRYHVCSMWQEEVFNEPDFDALKPCAYETIWTVRGKYLDMFLNQRSGDMLAASGAGGINEVQYAALLIMVARHTGYTPGKFTHCVINEQIYDRHFDQARELLNRFLEQQKKYFDSLPQYHMPDDYWKDEFDYLKAYQNYNTPRLILNPEKSNFYEMAIDDFPLENYDPVKPQLQFNLGI